MSSWRRIRSQFEVLLTRLALRVIPRLPRRCILGMSTCFGTLGYALAGATRRVALTNLQLAFGPTLTAAAKRRITRQSFRTFALAILDIFWFTRETASRIDKYVSVDPSMNVFFDHTKAHVCITAHLGCWELMGHATAIRGFPLVSVAAPLINPGVDVIVADIRQQMGQTVVAREGAVRSLMKALRNGGKVGLLLDQNTKPCEGGTFIPFFGLPATTSLAAAVLALRTGAGIIAGFCRPQPDGTYRVSAPSVEISTEGFDKRDPKAPAALTAQIGEAIEAAIREEPGAWLWMYKRWKYIPPDEDPARFPDYARKLHPNELR